MSTDGNSNDSPAPSSSSPAAAARATLRPRPTPVEACSAALTALVLAPLFLAIALPMVAGTLAFLLLAVLWSLVVSMWQAVAALLEPVPLALTVALVGILWLLANP